MLLYNMSMTKLLPWLASLGILVVFFGTVYTVVQQAQRSDANYPQIQLAQDTADSLNNGTGDLNVYTGNVDIAKSLAPFTIVYDKKGNVVSGTGFLNGKVPKAPIGILEGAKGEDYHVVTWEPKGDIRIAAVTVAAKDYYVLSGRSLKEVEKNESRTLLLSFLGGVIATLLLGLIFAFNELRPLQHRPTSF
jgi:hypothetical protein